jgi:hypothetical protein
MLSALLALTLGGCGDSFVSPEIPDLYKKPRDLGLVGTFDGAFVLDQSVPDLSLPDQSLPLDGSPLDQSATKDATPDLTHPVDFQRVPDLSPPPDLSHPVDLSPHDGDLPKG